MAINGILCCFLARGQRFARVYRNFTGVSTTLAHMFFCYPHFMEEIPDTCLRGYQSPVIFLGRFWESIVVLFSSKSSSGFRTYQNIFLTGQSTTSNDSALQSLGKIMSVNHIFFALLYVVTVAIIAPVIEELVFRGFATIFSLRKIKKYQQPS